LRLALLRKGRLWDDECSKAELQKEALHPRPNRRHAPTALNNPNATH
jgi:hypothetical protein